MVSHHGAPIAGPTNSLLDVPGLSVGQVQRTDPGWLTGVSLVLAGADGAVAGVDVRGGGPGTRETDLLDPRNVVERVHAIVLTGGSAFGLAAADGVMAELAAAGIGFPVGVPGQVVPIVPAAVIFDLGRGGDFGHHPGPDLGREAYRAAQQAQPIRLGGVGAGTGATAGGLKGGVGTASQIGPAAPGEDGSGWTVAAFVVVNAFGSTICPDTGQLYAADMCLSADLPRMGLPTQDELEAARAMAQQRQASQPLAPAMATTIAVIATDVTLTKAQCAKVAGIDHDGLARAIRPVHTMFDGDTVFTLATGTRPAPDPVAFHGLLEAAADCLTRAVARAIVAAESVTTPAGTWRGYRDAFPSAFLA